MRLLDLSSRARIGEAMDHPDSPEDQLHRTLDQFQTVNRLFSRYRGVLNRVVLADLAADPTHPRRLADLGAGGCDIPRWLVRRCRARGLNLTILAVDHDPRVVRHAQAASAGYTEIQVVQGDVLDAELWDGVDYVFANHLLHHLSDEACVELIRRIDRMGPRRYLLGDLVRSAWAYGAFWLAMAPWFHRSFVLPDGLASIRRGFTLPEVRALVRAAAPIHPVTVGRLLPSRFLIHGGVGADSPGPGREWESI